MWRKKTLIIACSLLLSFEQIFLWSSEPFAIIGGEGNYYAALVTPNGYATPLNGVGLPQDEGFINSVAINSSGAGIIGGGNSVTGDAYAALVSLSGSSRALSGPVVFQGEGQIYSVAINSSGAGIIGGFDNTDQVYVALVSSSGRTRALSGAAVPQADGQIYSVAINSSGAGIIGGFDNTDQAYAALFSANGQTTALGGDVLVGEGYIYSVAINDAGFAIIGGQDATASPYAAVVSPVGLATEVTGAAIPGGGGVINNVAINASGAGIIGGQDLGGANHPYVALVAKNGQTTALSGPATPQGTGYINSVAINDSGSAIIGGQDNGLTTSYAALVSPSGVTTALTGSARPQGTGGFINSVAINPSGSAIIAGKNAGVITAPYVALVAPNGQTTALTGPATPEGIGIIYSAAIINPVAIGNQIDPKSFGPGNAFGNAVLSFSTSVLQNHLKQFPQIQNNTQEVSLMALTADQGLKTPYNNRKNSSYRLWFSPMGLYSHIKQDKTFPSLNNLGTGGMLGFDYLGLCDLILGGGVAYIYEYVGIANNLGHSRINQELWTGYMAWNAERISIQGSLWGGVYQMRNKRITLGVATSTSFVTGGLFNPHLAVSVPFRIKNKSQSFGFSIEPFAMVDWVNNWQGRVKEKGSSGLNLRLNRQYVCLLRSEGGAYFLQTVKIKHGTFNFAESLSYVNILPFNAQKRSTYYVSSISTFDIQVFNSQTQNLGAARGVMRFTPCHKKAPYISLMYLGELGSKAFYNTFSLEIGWRF